MNSRRDNLKTCWPNPVAEPKTPATRRKSCPRGIMRSLDLPATYRDVAEEVRQLADRVCHVPDIHADLLELSARFERMAAYYSAQADHDLR